MGENDKKTGFAGLARSRGNNNATPRNATADNTKIVALLKRAVKSIKSEKLDYKNIQTKAREVKVSNNDDLPLPKVLELLDLLGISHVNDVPLQAQQTTVTLLSTVVAMGSGKNRKARVTNGLSWLDEKMRSWGEQPSGEVLDNTISQLLKELKEAKPNSLAPSKKYIAKRKANVATPKTAALNVALATELLVKDYKKEDVSALKKQANKPTRQAVVKVMRLINSMKPDEKKKLLQRVQPLQKAATPNSLALQAVFTELLQRTNEQKATNPFEPNANTTGILHVLQRISTAIEKYDKAKRLTLASTVTKKLNKISPVTSTPKDRVEVIAKCLKIEITLKDLPHYEMRDTVATIAEAVFEAHDTVDEGLKWLNDALTDIKPLDIPTQNGAIQNLKAAAEQKLSSKRLAAPTATPRSIRALVYYYTLGTLLRALHKGYTAIVNRLKARITSPEQKTAVQTNTPKTAPLNLYCFTRKGGTITKNTNQYPASGPQKIKSKAYQKNKVALRIY